MGHPQLGDRRDEWFRGLLLNWDLSLTGATNKMDAREVAVARSALVVSGENDTIVLRNISSGVVPAYSSILYPKLPVRCDGPPFLLLMLLLHRYYHQL